MSDQTIDYLKDSQITTGIARDEKQELANQIYEELFNKILIGTGYTQEEFDYLQQVVGELDALTKKYDQLTEDLAMERERNTNLKEELKSKNNEIPVYEIRLSNYDYDILKATGELREAENKILDSLRIINDKQEQVDNTKAEIADCQQGMDSLSGYIKEYEEAKDKLQIEINNYETLNFNILDLGEAIDKLYYDLGHATYDLIKAEALSKKVSEAALLFETKYNEFIQQYDTYKGKYDNAQNVVDTLLSFINGANNYIASLQNEIEAGKLVERSKTALKEVKNTYLDLVKVINEYKVVAEPKPEPAPVMTDADVQEIVEKNIWTKDPGEYTHEEVVRSLENLANLQKIQLQDPATMVFFIETYQNYRDVLKEQLADLLQAFNITFEEVEAIFMRVIFA